MEWWGCSPWGLSPYCVPGTGDEATAGLALRWPLPPACPPHTDTLLSRDIQARGINLPYVPGDGEGSTPGEKHVCRDWGANFPQELLEQLRQASTAQLVAGTFLSLRSSRRPVRPCQQLLHRAGCPPATPP